MIYTVNRSMSLEAIVPPEMSRDLATEIDRLMKSQYQEKCDFVCFSYR